MATRISTPAGERESIEAFKRDVIDASMEALVILDFWAEWCGPCKQLGPVLEKVAADYADRGVRLAKIDVDKNQTIAAQFRVQSIPTVYAIFQGRPIADLTPARTEGELKQFLDQILPQLPIGEAAGNGADDAAAFIEAGQAALEAGRFAEAEKIFAALHAENPADVEHAAALARALIGQERFAEAEALLAGLPEGSFGAALEQARAALALARERVPQSELEALRQAVDTDPGDHQKRFDLASALAASGDNDGAADHLLSIIRTDPGWNEGAARARLLKLFEAVGLDDPWVGATRRKLSAILFA